jgi:hypothetical protein
MPVLKMVVGKRAPRHLALIAVLLAAAMAPACGGSTPTVPSGVTRAAITLAVDPNPVPAVVNALTLTVSGSYKITVSETNGLGGELIFVSSTVFDPETGAQVAINYYDGSDLVVFVGAKRIEASKSLTIPQTISYVLPESRTAANLTVAAQFKDDRGNLINQALQVQLK